VTISSIVPRLRPSQVRERERWFVVWRKRGGAFLRMAFLQGFCGYRGYDAPGIAHKPLGNTCIQSEHGVLQMNYARDVGSDMQMLKEISLSAERGIELLRTAQPVGYLKFHAYRPKAFDPSSGRAPCRFCPEQSHWIVHRSRK
jgi:hypothetical protein